MVERRKWQQEEARRTKEAACGSRNEKTEPEWEASRRNGHEETRPWMDGEEIKARLKRIMTMMNKY
jgi:hypothetical protein